MAINFPNNPSVNDTFTVGGINFTFTGVKWESSAVVEISSDTTPSLGGTLDAGTHNINNVGVITATTFSGNLIGNVTGTATTATYAQTAGIATNAQGLTGDPSIQVTNATVLGNLDVQGTTTTIDTAITEVDSLNVEGSVGIGTTNPGAKLEVHSDAIPRINTVFQGSKHVGMSVGGSGGGFVLTDGHFMTVNHQPYADRGTDNNLTERLRITTGGIVQITGGVNVSGVVTATSFSGITTSMISDYGNGISGGVGAGSTNLVTTWTLGTDTGSSQYYSFTGPGVADGAQDPTIYLVRGQAYKFENRTGGHPFRIQYEFENTGGTAYNDGIPTNPAGNGDDLYWEVRNDAPDLLHYQCTSHQNMSGRIVILGDVVSSGSWTASAGTAQTIDTITGVANNAIKTAEYTIHIENGSNMQAQKVLVMQDGTTAFYQEYAIMHKSGLLVSMSATISGGNLLLQATPETGVTGTTTYKITRQTMR